MGCKTLLHVKKDVSFLALTQLISFFVFVILTTQAKGYIMSNNGILLEDLKFSAPCPEKNYKFHDPTGNFMCVVPRPKECFKLCQEMGCTEWNHMNLVPSGSEEIKRHHRCRCFPEYNMCFYNYVPRIYRDFD